MLSSRIREPQNLVRIECEQRNINLLDHPAQQRSSFDNANLLIGQQISQGIHFNRQLAESVIGGRPASTEGVVFFPQGGNYVGKSLERASRLFLQRHRKEPPDKQFGERQSCF